MKRTIVLTGLLMLAGSAQATVYYVSDCQVGAVANCVAGNDANAGTSPAAAWQTIGYAFSKFSSLHPGDQILFARGGSFTSADNYLINNNSQAANPLVIADYTPSWYPSGTNRPILTYAMTNPPDGGRAILRFENPGYSHHDEGYVIRNLEFRGSGVGVAIFFSNDVDDVLMENLLIDGFAIGVQSEGGNTPYDPGSNGMCDRITLRNSRIVNNTGMGFLGLGNSILIENNQFENNGTAGGIRNHNLYLEQVGDDNVVRGNDLYRASMSGGVCTGTSLVAHGVHNGLVIENNTVREDVAKTNDGCYGISVTVGYSTAEGSPGAVIRGNRVVNVGGIAISATSCPNCVIEDNVIVEEQPTDDFTGIKVPDRGRKSIDMPDTDAIVRNNSIYFSGAVTGSVGIYLGDEGTGHAVVNNAIHYVGTSSNVSGFWLNLPATSYAAVDNNIYYSPSAPNSKWEGSRGQALAQWRVATGFDVHSLQANPLFTSPASPSSDLSISAGSPAINTGNIAFGSPVDITGQSRDATPDIGAYEYIAGVRLSLGDVSVTEGNAGSKTVILKVTLSAPATDPVTVGFATGEAATPAASEAPAGATSR